MIFAIRLIAVIGVLVFAAPPSVDAAVYRWVDENGRVHYSDRVPPGYSRLGHDKLNEAGRVIDSVEAAKTPEKIEAEKQQAALEAAQSEREATQARRDRVLLQTFTTENDLKIMRDDRLAIIDNSLAIAERERTQLEGGLAALDDPADERAQDLRERLARVEVYIETKRRERQEIEERFEADLKRYRKLKSAAAE